MQPQNRYRDQCAKPTQIEERMELYTRPRSKDHKSVCMRTSGFVRTTPDPQNPGSQGCRERQRRRNRCRPVNIVRSVSVHDHLGQFVADASHDELVRQEGFVANLKIKCRNINIIVFRFRDLGTRRRIKGQTHFEDNVMENVHVVQLRSERFQIREHFRVVHLRDLVQGSVRKDLENGEIPALRIASHRRAAKHSRKSGN